MDIQQFTVLPAPVMVGIQHVHEAVFGDALSEHKLANRKNFLALVAIEDGIVAGFKLGYEHEDGVFYSWLGGVHPSYQRRGIARQLMDAQHTLCKEMGYTRVRTYSRNEKMAMLLLNLQSGFHIMSTFTDDKGWHKIVLEKQL